ncbi:MAG: hypothetical protein QOH60_2129 [Mycobacterium sp.]|jgi:adenylate cyclase|nr:hypothetical protein [Mycobacterium sp.]
MTTRCASCGAELSATAKFCSECGTSVQASAPAAEYKQVTILFADVVRSMDIAASVGAERLREIMAEVFKRSSTVVKRYGGTVDKFTGDGIMAVFGAPVALEDHALRACLAALDLQKDVVGLASEVQRRDGLELQLRAGLNSGQVIAGQIGSGPSGYTTIGEQVGMAQRMESAAPPGGVMLSESTARLVDDATVLGEPEMVHIKGAEKPMAARRLLEMKPMPSIARQGDLALVGRRWELSAVEGILDRIVEGHGGVIGVVGPPGIGKSRLTRELAALAGRRNFEVFSAFCESHTSDVAFHAAARLLRSASRAGDLDDESAREQIKANVAEADEHDLLLFYDLIGIRDPATPLPAIDPEARRRRLSAFVKAAALARDEPAVYIVEDAHWIDKVSESMIADLLTVIPQTRSVVVVTYRPEYRGVLARTPDAQTISLAPLSHSDSAKLTTELLGRHSSVGQLAPTIVERAAGNPFFVQEIVRDLMERNVLQGNRGALTFSGDGTAVTVPATLQATIAARIDRLEPSAKRALSTASVIGSRFSSELLGSLGINTALDELVTVDLIDQVRFTQDAEYVFHHPLIRRVAYESLLRSDRADLHRRVAASIESQHPRLVDENAALIAEHLEAAGDLVAAYEWHMRAAAFAGPRDPQAARASWQRATGVADQLPLDDPGLMSKRITPRIQLCATSWLVWGESADEDFRELERLCLEADDPVSRAIGMTGYAVGLLFENRFSDSAQASAEVAALIDTIGDSNLQQLLAGASNSMMQGGRVREGLRVIEITIDAAPDRLELAKFAVVSVIPVATGIRGVCRYALGVAGWKEDLDHAIALAHSQDATSFSVCLLYKYAFAMHNGALLPDAEGLRLTAEAIEIASQASDDFAYEAACLSRGLLLLTGDESDRTDGFRLINLYREAGMRRWPSARAIRAADTEIARRTARDGDLDRAIDLARTTVEYFDETGEMTSRGPAVTVLVESLLQRGGDGDLAEAEAAIERLTEVPTDPGFVLHELPLLRLRALTARARGDEARYRDFTDQYSKMANDLGFEGHMAIAATM